ncbi:AMP-binding protein [Winogradskyella sp. DF17]|uniref:AMP-binding protein n=1 Tax=Winogradskyella pelagia TaxID=2819984 RepID=A0ABS3T2C5_9FLAO|nr:AMP-binding protein [Winogradskyella sp. DF17]MBO3116898.1 AMP-binding protein [Winogradskyella sp. DF17]
MSQHSFNPHNEFVKKISDNNKLNFVDASSDSKYNLSQLMFPVHSEFGESKQLGFIYVDSGIKSLAIYFSFLNSSHALVLLSDTLDSNLKQNLEKIYRPAFIYDNTRDSIGNYKDVTFDNGTLNARVFRTSENLDYTINPEVKILLSTSGTTGSPKLVKLSFENIQENALSISDYLPINGEDVTPLNLPLNYSYGLSVLHSNAIKGGTIVCGIPDILSKAFWTCFDKYGFTSIAGVPFIYEMLYRIGFLKKEYPSLEYISQAGGNLSKNIKEKFNSYCEKNTIEFYVMYGQTEATARISFVPPAKLNDKLTSIGKPIKKGHLRIDDKTEELLYSGPNVFGGYAESITDLNHWESIDWLKTGDIAYTDTDGFYYIKGRLKRIVKVFGNRVNLDEIERYLKLELSTAIIACTGIDDKFILVAYTEIDMNTDLLKRRLFETFKIQGSAVKFMYIETFPMTKNEKVDYKEIATIYKSK